MCVCSTKSYVAVVQERKKNGSRGCRGKSYGCPRVNVWIIFFPLDSLPFKNFFFFFKNPQSITSDTWTIPWHVFVSLCLNCIEIIVKTKEEGKKYFFLVFRSHDLLLKHTMQKKLSNLYVLYFFKKKVCFDSLQSIQLGWNVLEEMPFNPWKDSRVDRQKGSTVDFCSNDRMSERKLEERRLSLAFIETSVRSSLHHFIQVPTPPPSASSLHISKFAPTTKKQHKQHFGERKKQQ